MIAKELGMPAITARRSSSGMNGKNVATPCDLSRCYDLSGMNCRASVEKGRAMRRLSQNLVLLIVVCLGFGCVARDDLAAQMTTEDFAFSSDGLTLSGVIDQPATGEARALVIFVHGYGGTDLRGRNMYHDLRSRFAELGIASVVWDKPGQGRSEGKFDIDQPVEDSAREVLDAAAWLRAHGVPGTQKMGIWGFSRAGWIAPIAMSQDDAFDFWISVAGTTKEDNIFYLLMSNLPYEGSTIEEAELLEKEWKRGFEIFRTGGSYEEYRAATTNLRSNPYIVRMTEDYTKEKYEAEQLTFLNFEGEPPLDMETGMPISVPNFEEMLASLDIDVLALFGEKDLNIDWRKVRALYEETIGTNSAASLTVETFPDGDHAIDVSRTGSMREMQDMRGKSEGYYETQVEWLREHVVP